MYIKRPFYEYWSLDQDVFSRCSKVFHTLSQLTSLVVATRCHYVSISDQYLCTRWDSEVFNILKWKGRFFIETVLNLPIMLKKCVWTSKIGSCAHLSAQFWSYRTPPLEAILKVLVSPKCGVFFFFLSQGVMSASESHQSLSSMFSPFSTSLSPSLSQPCKFIHLFNQLRKQVQGEKEEKWRHDHLAEGAPPQLCYRKHTSLALHPILFVILCSSFE